MVNLELEQLVKLEWTHCLLGETDPEADLESLLGDRDLQVREKGTRDERGGKKNPGRGWKKNNTWTQFST